MKSSDLYETYRAFRKPTFTLKVNNTWLNVGEGAVVRCMECRLTTLRQAGSLTLRAELEPRSDLGRTWLNAIQPGAVCTLSLGYVNTERMVFSGFVYEAAWDDPLCCGVQGIEMTCLDVRGQLMLSSCADAGPARRAADPSVLFDGKNGLIALRRRRSLAGQCAAVAVSGSDDRGERLYVRQARASDSGFGMNQAGSALTMDLHQAEPAVRTMAQAAYLAKARMRDRQRRSGMLLGRCTGLPELRPGRFLEVAGLGEPVNGSYYVQTVVHTVDETGFETCFEAED